MDSNSKKRDQEQLRKPVFISLGVIALLTVGLGLAQVVSSINKPQSDFWNGRETTTLSTQTTNTNTDEALSVDLLRDTDEDGLTDYEEVTIYGTSPYLPDTDSDGYTDDQEIVNGYDPNCPVGQNCRTVYDNGDTEIPSDLELLNETTDQQNGALSLPEDITNLSVDQIRALIIDSGEVSEDDLNQLTDEQIQSIYREAIGATAEQ